MKWVFAENGAQLDQLPCVQLPSRNGHKHNHLFLAKPAQAGSDGRLVM
jgi:hypothetical protein